MQQPDHQPRSERLTRDLDHKILGGVCAGIARHYGYDTTVVRVVAVLLTLVWGAGILVYAVLWMVMPTDEQGRNTAIAGTLGEASSDPLSAPRPPLVDEDLADRAKRAAEEFAVAARSAAETARVAAEQFAEVAKAAAAAGRVAWDQQQQQRAAARTETSPSEENTATSNASSSTATSPASSTTSSSDAPATPPPPPMTPPPPSQTSPLPHEDVKPE